MALSFDSAMKELRQNAAAAPICEKDGMGTQLQARTLFIMRQAAACHSTPFDAVWRRLTLFDAV